MDFSLKAFLKIIIAFICGISITSTASTITSQNTNKSEEKTNEIISLSDYNENLIIANEFYGVSDINAHYNCYPITNGIEFDFPKKDDSYFRAMLKEPLKAGETYTFSCNITGLKDDESVCFGILWQNINNFSLSKDGFVSKTFIVDDSYDNINWLLIDDYKAYIPQPTTKVQMTNIKLEKGDKATRYIN